MTLEQLSKRWLGINQAMLRGSQQNHIFECKVLEGTRSTREPKRNLAVVERMKGTLRNDVRETDRDNITQDHFYGPS